MRYDNMIDLKINKINIASFLICIISLTYGSKGSFDILYCIKSY